MRGLRTLLLMLWARLGSFNAIKQEKPGGRWRGWLGGDIPSAETLGRCAAAAGHDDVRRTKTTRYEWWDIEGFTTWTQLGHPVRVVRSVETRTVTRQRTAKPHSQTTEWLWATSLPKKLAPTRLVVEVGHGRWTIENEGFNTLVNEWHADHLYRHDLDAMLTLWLLVCLAYNLYTVWLTRNVRPELRRGRTRRWWAKRIERDFFNGLPDRARPP